VSARKLSTVSETTTRELWGAETRKALEFIPVDRIEEVFEAAFTGKRRTRPQSAQSIERQAAASALRSS